MSSAPSAREAILRSIREGLARSAEIEAKHPLHNAIPPKPRPAAQPVVAPAPPPSPLAAFRARMEAVGGRVVEASDEGEAAAAVASVLAELGIRTLAVTDAPLALAIAARLRDSSGLEVLANATSEQLFDCDAGLTEAQWGIVETGTLVLASARERNRLASLVPPVHVALLRASNLRDTIGDALAAAREPDGSVPSHVITFITGPSRTSDIELTLAIGVHGPQVLLVVIIP
jgi:L-lactate dehydrogenase complex protein LldG